MKRLCLLFGVMALVALGLAACGDDSSSTVTDKETKTDKVTNTVTDKETNTVTDEEQAPASAATTSTSTEQKDCPPGEIAVIATGKCAKDDAPTTGSKQKDCPPGEIAVIATGKCAKE